MIISEPLIVTEFQALSERCFFQVLKKAHGWIGIRGVKLLTRYYHNNAPIRQQHLLAHVGLLLHSYSVVMTCRLLFLEVRNDARLYGDFPMRASELRYLERQLQRFIACKALK